MKIDRTKLKRSSSDVPPDCKAVIDKLKLCNHHELLEELSKITIWNWGKCELYHWIDVLDAFDYILGISCGKTKDNQWCLPCDNNSHECMIHKQLLICVLQFTALLIEHSFSSYVYNSMEHLTTLLSSSDMNLVVAVLNLLGVFSKKSYFMTQLDSEKSLPLMLRLQYLAEKWGGKEKGFKLSECCQNLSIEEYPPGASNLHFEYFTEKIKKNVLRKSKKKIITIHIDNVDQIPNKTPSNIMEELILQYSVPEDKQVELFTRIRLAHSFSDYVKRILCVQARLQALSVLVYCNAVPDSVDSFLNNGLIKELVDVLELPDENLIDVKISVLRTLTPIIHLDRNPDLCVYFINAIIDATGSATHLGFLPALVRSCIQSLTEPDSEVFPLPFATALFSFLYHLASYECGGSALVSCTMVESLLKVINLQNAKPEFITFVTMAVRIIDLITNLDTQAFQAQGGFVSLIQRLEVEVNVCRQEQPFVINPILKEKAATESKSFKAPSSESETDIDIALLTIPRATDSESDKEKGKHLSDKNQGCSKQVEEKEAQCFPQRAALLKSILNFFKKSIQDVTFSDDIKHLTEGSFFSSLKHIISNAEYYGATLFLLATDVLTVYIFQEPVLLPQLQASGFTDVLLHAFLIKEVPATRDVLVSLSSVFRSLCLNHQGLQSFVQCKPFEKLFQILVSPKCLPAMRKHRRIDPIGDAVSAFGNAIEELMRYEPSLIVDATAATIKLLEELCAMGRDPIYTCPPLAVKIKTAAMTINISNDAGSSDEEDCDDIGSAPVQGSLLRIENKKCGTEDSSLHAVPLVDYILNVVKFIDAMLSNNSTVDHCELFVSQKGLIPLMNILGSPNLQIDFPVSPTCQAISSVCKSILNTHEPQVLLQGLLHLNEVLQCFEHLLRPLDHPGGSVLLEELLRASNVDDTTLSALSTPLFYYMAATHAYIAMLHSVSQTEQSDIQIISIKHWGSDLGLMVLKGLFSLQTFLMNETTVLLALGRNDNFLAEDMQFGWQQLQKLISKDSKHEKEETSLSSSTEFGSTGGTSAMDASSASSSSVMDIMLNLLRNQNTGKVEVSSAQWKHLKPLVLVAIRLGMALAGLFQRLVKLCVSTMCERPGQTFQLPNLVSDTTHAVATDLTQLLTMILSWEPPPASPVPKLRLSLYTSAIGFISPMLFDERTYAYHLILQKFFSGGGLDLFFNIYYWVLTYEDNVSMEDFQEQPVLPREAGELLFDWMTLLEKLVNNRNILESPHTIAPMLTESENIDFDPLAYLSYVQERAYEEIQGLWERKLPPAHSAKIAELMITVADHVIKRRNIT